MTRRSSGAYPYPRDWHNYHYDDRQTWLVSPWPEPAKSPRRIRIAPLLTRLGGMLHRLSPGWRVRHLPARP